MNASMRELSFAEVDQVDGGILPLIPIAIAFGKGLGMGVAAGGVALVLADAVGLVKIN